MAVMDAQSTRVSPQGGESGFDAGKKVKRRKRNLAVDTMGLLIAVTITAASVQDKDAAAAVVAQACAKSPQLEKLRTDGAYGEKCVYDIEHAHHIRVEVVRRPGNSTIGTLHDPKTAPEPASVINAKYMVLRGWPIAPRHPGPVASHRFEPNRVPQGRGDGCTAIRCPATRFAPNHDDSARLWIKYRNVTYSHDNVTGG